MRQELDEKLCKDYPKIFANRNGDMITTAMCWGFECSDGWYNTINALCYNIQEHIDWKISTRERLLKNNPHNLKVPDEVEQVVAVQVKEKFGTLRFYTNGGDDYTHGLISMAESMSAVTCETCGAPGKRRGRGWIYTACVAHTHEEDLIDGEGEE
jgi:hypothetical protein